MLSRTNLFRRCLATTAGRASFVGATQRAAPPATNLTCPHTASSRALSTFPRPANGPLRSTPQYTVFGEMNMLSIKVIPPIFRCLKNGALVMDNNKKGRILLEWSPRGDGGGFNRDAQIRFGLSPEEAGFLLHQLPDNVVEFVRRTPSDSTTSGSVAADLPEKVLRITPGEGGQFSFKVDYEKDGVGGQTVVGSDAPLGPLEVVAQLGEYVVIMELIKCSLPSLTGWDVQLNLAMQNSVNIAVRSSTGNFDSGGYSRPVTQKADDSDLPF